MPILFAVVLIDLIGFGIVIPILPFLSPQLGAHKMDIALIIATYAVCSGLCGPSWGRLSDRLGRKPVIMICLAGGALSYVMLGLATELWMVYAARGFAGLMAGNFGVASAMMADISKPENRARSMGMIGVAWGLGLVLGPLLGGLLSGDDGSFVLPCIVAGGMSTLALLAAGAFLRESVTADRRAANHAHQRSGEQASVWRMLRETGNRLLVMQYVLHSACASSVTYIVPLWVGDLLGWGAREVGVLFGIQGAIIILMQGVGLGPLVKALGEMVLLRTAITFFLAGISIAVFADSMGWMVAAVYIGMSGATLCMPLLNSITTQRTPLPLRGRMLGTTNSAGSWGRVVGPVLSGTNLAVFGYTGAWIGVVMILVAYLTWALREDHEEPAR